MSDQEQRNPVWEKVLLARHPKRPTARHLIDFLVTDFIELHGDRFYADDTSFICGIGWFNKIPITIIAQEKGQTTQEKMSRNFGMPHPEGYRKALRLMKQAEKFHRPVLFIIDTPGAYPGIGAEERGQASAIAVNLEAMAGLKTPLISVVLGEGGSGGALAIGLSDAVWMFENAMYSILSPEGFASILYKDVALAPKIVHTMKITAQDLYQYHLIDAIIPEVEGGLHLDSRYSFSLLKQSLEAKLSELQSLDFTTLLEQRYQKYRKMGQYEE